jgi:hypothetical protein
MWTSVSPCLLAAIRIHCVVTWRRQERRPLWRQRSTLWVQPKSTTGTPHPAPRRHLVPPRAGQIHQQVRGGSKPSKMVIETNTIPISEHDLPAG